MANQYGVKDTATAIDGKQRHPSSKHLHLVYYPIPRSQQSPKCRQTRPCRKPMSTTPEQARQFSKNAKENDLHLTVGLMRFIPGLQLIRQSVENKK